jgi:hypothetical protein
MLLGLFAFIGCDFHTLVCIGEYAIDSKKYFCFFLIQNVQKCSYDVNQFLHGFLYWRNRFPNSGWGKCFFSTEVLPISTLLCLISLGNITAL